MDRSNSTHTIVFLQDKDYVSFTINYDTTSLIISNSNYNIYSITKPFWAFFILGKKTQTIYQHTTHGYQGLLKVIYKQLPKVFSIIGFILILGIFNFWIVVVDFASVIAQFLLSLRSNQYVMKKYKSFSNFFRVKNYCYGVTHDFSYGKDIRMYISTTYLM